MYNLIKKLVFQKKILILGFGREGKSTLAVLEKTGGYECLDISDKNPVSAENAHNHPVISGEAYLDCLEDYDIVFKSPGVVLPKAASEYSCQVLCQTEVFIRQYRDQIIGITGTKGKSTTSSLLSHVLSVAGKKVLFAGNIGIPVFDIVDEIDKDSIIVIELSCHQLEYAMTSPKTAILLNIYEDHLDHYKTREKYAAAKENIYLHQMASDRLLTTQETVAVDKCPSKLEYINTEILPFKSFSDIEGVKLRGEHNLLNCAFVYSICKSLEVSDRTFINALSTFKPLAHRLEPIGRYDGIDYYDDSISTTVMSTINAVKSIDNASTLLIGGMERGLEYDELIDFLWTSKLSLVICMYESGARMYEMFKAKESGASDNRISVVKVDDLESAVEYARKNTPQNGAVILSPAAASYGYFKNFEERGDFFAKYVAQIKV